MNDDHTRHIIATPIFKRKGSRLPKTFIDISVMN